MSATKSSCIDSLPNDRFVVIRKSWVDLCDHNHCAAALLNFFVSWHDWKLENYPRAEREVKVATAHGVEIGISPSLIQHHTISELKSGLSNLYSDRSISAAIKLLEQKGFISSFANPDPRFKFDKTRHYLVMPEAINKSIELLKTAWLSNLPKSTAHKMKLHDAQAKTHDADAFLLNHYEYTSEDTYQNTVLNTPPTPSADEGSVCEGSVYQAELVEEENSQHLSPSPEKTDNLSLVPITYSDSAYSGVCRTTESSTEIFNRTYGNRLTPQVLDAIAGKIIEIYNKAKPNHWVGCAQRSSLLKTRLNAVILNHYREHYPSLDGAINALSDDVGCCLLNLKDSKFFNSEKFENGNLLWLLSQPAKIAENAEAWRGRSQQSQQQVVAAAVEELEGIPHPQDGHLMNQSEANRLERLCKTLLGGMLRHFQKTGSFLHHPDLPSIDYLNRYFPNFDYSEYSQLSPYLGV